MLWVCPLKFISAGHSLDKYNNIYTILLTKPYLYESYKMAIPQISVYRTDYKVVVVVVVVVVLDPNRLQMQGLFTVKKPKSKNKDCIGMVLLLSKSKNKPINTRLLQFILSPLLQNMLKN